MNILPYTQADLEVRELAKLIQLVCEHPDLEQFTNECEKGFKWIVAQCDDQTDFGKLFNECVGLANEAFITDKGQTNYKELNKLKALGYRIEEGEKDSFGPLSMIIVTPKGRIVYG